MHRRACRPRPSRRRRPDERAHGHSSVPVALTPALAATHRRRSRQSPLTPLPRGHTHAGVAGRHLGAARATLGCRAWLASATGCRGRGRWVGPVARAARAAGEGGGTVAGGGGGGWSGRWRGTGPGWWCGVVGRRGWGWVTHYATGCGGILAAGSPACFEVVVATFRSPMLVRCSPASRSFVLAALRALHLDPGSAPDSSAPRKAPPGSGRRSPGVDALGGPVARVGGTCREGRGTWSR